MSDPIGVDTRVRVVRCCSGDEKHVGLVGTVQEIMTEGRRTFYEVWFDLDPGLVMTDSSTVPLCVAVEVERV